MIQEVLQSLYVYALSVFYQTEIVTVNKRLHFFVEIGLYTLFNFSLVYFIDNSVVYAGKQVAAQRSLDDECFSVFPKPEHSFLGTFFGIFQIYEFLSVSTQCRIIFAKKSIKGALISGFDTG